MLSIDDIRKQIADLVTPDALDPLALATAEQESGFRPTAIGDSGHSVGLFQENDQGAGAGLSVAQREDVAGSTTRFVDRVKRFLSTGYTGSPGLIAWEVQRPAGFPYADDPRSASYIGSVNALAAKYHDGTDVGIGPVGPTGPQGPSPAPSPAPSDGCQPGYHKNQFGSCIQDCPSGQHRDIWGNCVAGSPTTVPTPADIGTALKGVGDQIGALPGQLGNMLAVLAIGIVVVIVVLLLAEKGVSEIAS